MSNDLDIVSDMGTGDTTDPLSVVIHSINIHIRRVLLVIEFLPRLIQPPPKSDDEKNKARIIFAEILRSEIVLLHAILEDSLREVLRFKLKHDMSPELLTTIPLVGISQAGQPKKFGLEDLAKYREETVDWLIEASIDEYLDKTSFTSCQSIAGLLQKAGIVTDTLKIYFPSLDKMINRRHQIVHRADRIGDISKWQIPQIEPLDIVGWIMTVYLFIVDVSLLAHSPDERVEIQEELNNDENIKSVRAIMQQYFEKGTEALDTIELRERLQSE